MNALISLIRSHSLTLSARNQATTLLAALNIRSKLEFSQPRSTRKPAHCPALEPVQRHLELLVNPETLVIL